MNHSYSAVTNSFYANEFKDNYIKSGSWPTDAQGVSDEVYTEFAVNLPPEGKMRVSGRDGLPQWADIPAPTKEEYIAIAEAKRNVLLAEAAARIAPLQDAVDLGIATEKEVANLNALKICRVRLMRLDTSTAPDIDWPEVPHVA